MTVPAFGLGTFRLKEQTVIDSVRDALEIGYRAIDTAQIYENEAEIGQAIQDSGMPRDELYLTTKIWVDNFRRERLAASLQESLDRLKTDYVDLTLIHWPSPDGIPVDEFMTALRDARDEGLTREIGISNFNIDLMKQAIASVGADNIATNQVELHPFLQNRKLVELAHDQGIHITSYMTLAYGKVMEDPVLQQIAERHKASAAQIALAWALQLGYAVIPSSTKRSHLESNFEAQKLKLTDADMEEIAALDRNERLISPERLAPDWD